MHLPILLCIVAGQLQFRRGFVFNHQRAVAVDVLDVARIVGSAQIQITTGRQTHSKGVIVPVLRQFRGHPARNRVDIQILVANEITDFTRGDAALRIGNGESVTNAFIAEAQFFYIINRDFRRSVVVHKADVEGAVERVPYLGINFPTDILAL